MASKVENVEDMNKRMEALEHRMNQVEKSLQTVLARLDTVVLGVRPTITQAHRSPASAMVENVLKSGDYEYRPLDISRNEFRVLALNNSPKDEDPISCDLVHLSLDDDPAKQSATGSSLASMRASRQHWQFGALSYTWGSLELSHSIMVGGHVFKVTRNLEAALRQMRKNKRPSGRVANSATLSYWWIDALCINQKDIAERSQQVSCMTRIYKRAAAAYVWLGEEHDDSTTAMDIIRQLSVTPQRAPGEAEFKYPVLSTSQKEANRRALSALFRRSWWERVWVRQEIALPKTVIVCCGDATCHFAYMKLANNTLDRLKERLGLGLGQHDDISQESQSSADFERSRLLNTQHPSLIFALHQECMSGGNFISFKDAIFNARFCKATDPRDKVFSVLGLTDPETHGIAADYSLSLTATYKLAVRSLITATKSVDVLSACQNPERLHGFPSWVPNLVDEWKARPFQPIKHETEASYKEADCIFVEGSDVLRLNGEFFDTVETISDHSVHLNDSVEQLDALYLEWKSLVAQLLPKTDADRYSDPRPSDRDYVRISLLGSREDNNWIDFLSFGKENSHLMHYSKDGELLDQATPALDDIPNIRMARSLLLPDDLKVKHSKYHPVHTYLRKWAAGRRLCISTEGMIGLVPEDSQIGDAIVVFHGGSFPYIIRKCGEQHLLVGDAYLPNHKRNITGHLKSQYFSLV